MFKRTTLFIQVIVVVLVLIGVSLAFSDLNYFEDFYVREDGLIEWLTFLAHICTFTVCFVRLAMFRGHFFSTFNLSLAMIGAVFLFGAGEEISWGQRIFNFQSPDFFLHNNSQGEITIHNLILGDVRLNRVIFGTLKGIIVAIYFLIIPMAYGKYEKIRYLLDSCAIPIPTLQLIMFYLIMALIIWFIPSQKKGEILEFLGSWVFFVLVLAPKNRYIFNFAFGPDMNFIARGPEKQWP